VWGRQAEVLATLKRPGCLSPWMTGLEREAELRREEGWVMRMRKGARGRTGGRRDGNHGIEPPRSASTLVASAGHAQRRGHGRTVGYRAHAAQRNAQTRPIRRILYASDFSRASKAAFARACALARANRAELTLVHVCSRAIPYVQEAALRDQLRAAMRAEARKQLEALVAKARTASVRANALLLDGWPAEGILRAARSRRPDLVVIGTHGRTGLARAFLGSVAARVIATARCPVLTVRGK